MRDLVLKKNVKFTKQLLLEHGQTILDFINQVKTLDAKIEKFQEDPNCLFDISGSNNNLNLGYHDLKEALALIQSKLGEIELEEWKGKK